MRGVGSPLPGCYVLDEAGFCALHCTCSRSLCDVTTEARYAESRGKPMILLRLDDTDHDDHHSDHCDDIDHDDHHSDQCDDTDHHSDQCDDTDHHSDQCDDTDHDDHHSDQCDDWLHSL